MDILNCILGVIGTLTGSIALWMAWNSYRQNLTIERSDLWPSGYKVVNHSLRPIPIQKVELLVKKGVEFIRLIPSPEIRGLTLPGNLAPESSFEVDWVSARQTVEVCLQKETKLEVYTQTGEIFTCVHKHKFKK